jgi:hypothetical protein
MNVYQQLSSFWVQSLLSHVIFVDRLSDQVNIEEYNEMIGWSHAWQFILTETSKVDMYN